MSREFALKQAEEQIDILREALLESKEENEELETRLSLSISMYEGDRSPMLKLEEENAKLRRENEKEHKQVCQFIRDMYTGRFAKRADDYWELPQWIRDAIEADPIYNTEQESR